MIKILLPTDFSYSADFAADLAIDMSKKVKASLTFIHLMSFPEDYEQMDSESRKTNYPEILEKHQEVISKLEELSEKASTSHVQTDYLIKNESNLDYIKDYAFENKFDLIILGYKGANDTVGKKTTTYAKHLVSTSDTPVLVLKKPLNRINRAALLSDFNEEYIINESWINGFITKLDIDLSLACINTPSLFFDTRTMMSRIERFQKHYDVPTKAVIYNDYQFGAGIKHLCEDLELDLIIMNTHGHMNGYSITQQVVANTRSSILCLPVREN